MIEFPKKRVWGLLGAPRAGKNQVAQYLKESRGFATFAFADSIKEEFGISVENFEAAKITGKIEEIRQQLWEFSAIKKAQDPLYFINKVMGEAILIENSAVVTDIRTEDELLSFFNHKADRIYWVRRNCEDVQDGFLKGSKIKCETINEYINKDKIRILDNYSIGLFEFLVYMEDFFFKEDIIDLPALIGYKFDQTSWRSAISNYLSRFKIIRST